jgi:hypothetical protein
MNFGQYIPSRGLRTSTALDGNMFAVFVLEISAAQKVHNKAHCLTEVSAFHISVIAGAAPLCAFHHIVFITKWLSFPLNTIICPFRHHHPRAIISILLLLLILLLLILLSTTITTNTPFSDRIME